MLQFTSIDQFFPGILSKMLLDSYRDLIRNGGDCWTGEISKWNEFDLQVFDNPDSIGNCVFVSIDREQVVGFASYDPRPQPAYAIVGHNCIVPPYQNRGFGKQQVLEILRRFQLMGIRKAVVQTSEHPFFASARRMYLSCGFTKIGTVVGGPDPRFEIVNFEKIIPSIE